MQPPKRDDAPDVDRLRGYFFWLLAAGIIGSLWFYADARRAVAGHRGYLPPPPGFPMTQPAAPSHWTWKLPADDGLAGADPEELEHAE